jgi:hypothetical protein
MSEDTAFGNKGMKTRLDTTVATYRYKTEGHVAVYLYDILKGKQYGFFGH